MKCWDCPHFKIQYEPIGKISTGIWDFGQAKCSKHDLVVDFPNYRKLKKLECIEEQNRNGSEVVTREEYEMNMFEHAIQRDLEHFHVISEQTGADDLLIDIYATMFEYMKELRKRIGDLK